MSSQSQMLAMDFDGSKTPSYVDPVEFSYMDGGLDNYLQYSASTPTDLGLPHTTSPAGFNSHSLSNNIGVYTSSSIAALLDSLSRPHTPEGASIPPHTLTYSLSAGETSLDNTPRGRARPGSSVPYQATVPRSQQFNPIAARAVSRPILMHKRRTSRSNDESEDEDEELQPTAVTSGSNDSRLKATRKQRIESEKRRRGDLRDGLARLKHTLPLTNQKLNNGSVLKRATSHIRSLETVKEQLELRLKSAEAEVHRLRNVSEAFMLGAASQRQQGAF
ncbi:hypothetical protein D9611_012682 [Ephemerocybe angulata]|uniref:Uncharacterized protein n=2 Tax=Ephemerocybe angulata TaxID=980116 RepID=A0A8H6HRD2_9AGAR|nr:hypothetical protein D9611_012682 [Tulosesus angulatus]KAF6751770.1 hypothetical protein DFP72DRAFT_1135656 [Tulosesus angulatus]